MKTWKVGIIGGGPGGLMTAYSLQKIVNNPVQVTLFEASNRLGGKILTPQFETAQVRYEAGAAEFYDYSEHDQDPLKELIAELGLPISPMGGSAVIMDNQVLSNMDDIYDQLGPQTHGALVDFDQVAKGWCAAREFYGSDYPDGSDKAPSDERFDSVLATVKDATARHYLKQLIHSDLATEPELTSCLYGMQNYVMNDPAYMLLYGIDGGNELLPEALAARLDANIRLGHKVTEVEKINLADTTLTKSTDASVASSNQPLLNTGGPEPIVIRSSYEGNDHEEQFDFVVVALPHNHLRWVNFLGSKLAPAIQEHSDYYNYPAHYLRMTLLFERPFWKDSLTDSYWMLDQFGGCCLYDESSRDPGCNHGVLGWLLGGNDAEELSLLTDQQLIEMAIDSLPEFLSQGRCQFIEGQVHRWTGAVNAMPGGVVPRSLDRRHLPEPIDHPNLFMVGDYLFDSTLNGVLDSANYVAAWLTAKMADAQEIDP